GLGVGVGDRGRVPAGDYRALPPLRVAEEELRGARLGGYRVVQGVTRMEMTAYTYHVASLQRGPGFGPAARALPEGAVGEAHGQADEAGDDAGDDKHPLLTGRRHHLRVETRYQGDQAQYAGRDGQGEAGLRDVHDHDAENESREPCDQDEYRR